MSDLNPDTFASVCRFDSLELGEVFVLALAGEFGALDEFCKRVRPGLIQIAMFRIYGISREEAEDLAHETLVIFVERYREVTTSPTAYLRAILCNHIGNFLRRRFSIRALNGNGHTTTNGASRIAESTGDEIETRDLLERAERAISGMSEPCKTLLIGLIEGYQVKDLWRRMQELEPELKRSAFDRRLYVCRRRLWEILGVQL